MSQEIVRFRVNMPVRSLSVTGHVTEQEFRAMGLELAAIEASCPDLDVIYLDPKPDELPTFNVVAADAYDPLHALQMVKARLEYGFLAAAAFVP